MYWWTKRVLDPTYTDGSLVNFLLFLTFRIISFTGTPRGQGAMQIGRVLIEFHDIIGQMLCHLKMLGLTKFYIIYVADNLRTPIYS